MELSLSPFSILAFWVAAEITLLDSHKGAEVLEKEERIKNKLHLKRLERRRKVFTIFLYADPKIV